MELTFDGFRIGQDQFGHYDLGVANRVHFPHVVYYVLVLETTNHVYDRVHLSDIGEELVSQAFSLTCAFHQSGNVHHLDGGWNNRGRSRHFGERFQSLVGNLHDSYVRVDGAEGIVRCLRLAALGQRIEQGAFAHVGQTYDSSL